MSNSESSGTELEKLENLHELRIKRIKELEYLEIEKLEELENLNTIAMQNLERIETEKQEIEKERITNLTKKLSIISKDILLPYFFKMRQFITRNRQKNPRKNVLK